MKYSLLLLLISICLIQIKAIDKPETVVKYAKSKIGCGYVWGATGQILTQALLNSFYLSHPEHVDKSICSKWIGYQVFDCAGLVKMAFNEVGISLASGATSIWDGTSWQTKGTIGNYPSDKVCIVFRKEDNRMAHTGIYIGNGNYIHAAGSKSGVRMDKMSGSRWTHWGIPKNFYPDVPIKEVCSTYPCQAKVAGASSGRVNLRTGPDKNKDIIMKINNGEIVTVLSYENGWYKLTYSGKTGYMMAEYLVSV